jgi:hypothetical protein
MTCAPLYQQALRVQRVLIVHWTPAGEGKVAPLLRQPTDTALHENRHHTESKMLMPAARVKPSENKKAQCEFYGSGRAGQFGELVAEPGADGDLMAAFGAAAVEDGGACLGLHAREEAVGLGPVAAVRLEGTLRHDKNSCGRRRLLLKLLAIAAISEYT